MMTKLLTCSLLMFSIFGCFRKKTPPNNIEAWLGQEFPGKYEVLVSNLKMLDVMAQFEGRPAIRYAFPYFDKKPGEASAEPKGYVTGIYRSDDQAFVLIRKQKEY